MSDQQIGNRLLNKDKLLLKLLKSKTKNIDNKIRKHTQKYDHIPLSWGQQQLWVLSKLSDLPNTVYNMPLLFKMHGELDKHSLRSAFVELISRHDILRTTISIDSFGGPYQTIQGVDGFSMHWHDVTGEDCLDKLEENYQVLLNEYISKPFDLSRDVPIRVAVIRISELCHSVLIVLHHIACDAWSTGILADEITTLYNSFTKGKPSPLEDLTLQYCDYAIWQRDHLAKYVKDSDLKYWKSHLDGVPLLELPTDRPRPPTQSHRGRHFYFCVDSAAARHLKQFGQDYGCTLFMTVLGIFNVFLHKYSHQNDICVGTPVANRMQSELHTLIGYFVNTVALRNFIDTSKSFSELLDSIKINSMAAYERQQVPFESVVEAINPKRSHSHTPLFQVMLVLQNANKGRLGHGDGIVEYERVASQSSKFDLTLALEEMPDGSLHGNFEYATDLFDEATIQRMALHFVELARALTSAPSKSIGEVEFITIQERQQILVDWNCTAAPYKNEGCIHELFEEQVTKAPDATAIVFEDRELSYGELNSRANQLAHYLVQERGVKADTLVGICVERSLEMIVGIVAILKAGGAYVPLDPEYPQARLQYMLKDASLNTILVQKSLRDIVQLEDCKAVCIDESDLQAELSVLSTKNISPEIIGLKSSNLAYVIYTSGSTGNPKGVMIEHSGLSNRIEWMDRRYGSSALDRVLQKTPFSFDVSVWEIIWPITSGASIVLAKPGGHKDPVYLSDLISSQRVTKLHFVPSMLSSMLTYGNLAISDNVRQVFCSGEALLLSQVREFKSRYPNIELHNLYGPTEASIDVSYWNSEFFHNGLDNVPIGRPIQNIQLYVLDRQLKLVPLGVSGELYIGGVGLARGYLNRPDLTTEKFISNSFYDASNPASSERLYKTGDLCRYLPDGNIEFLGRIDHQVKIRGFRIELGEIENALIGYALVKDAVVTAKEDFEGDKQLVAFIVSDVQIAPAELREYLAKQIPDYMMPSAFVQLKELPLTPNGKVDRKTLASLPVYVTTSARYVAPRTKLEHQLAEIWARVLNRDISTISINDNFFELGGHSLMATRIVIQIRDCLGCDISLRVLFESPTIAALSVCINSDIETALLPAIIRLHERTQISISFAQERLWFLDQLEGNQSAYLVPTVFRLRGALNHTALDQAYASLLDRHEILRTNICSDENGQPYQLIHARSKSSIRVYALSEQDPSSSKTTEEVYRDLLTELTTKPFDLTSDELVRLTLIEHAPHDHTLVLVMHHIITDGWSMGILIKELSQLYSAYVQGSTNPLATLPIQYADYSVWQREYLQGGVLEKQANYWQEQLRDIPVLELPTDRPRPPVQSYRGGWLSLSIPNDIARALKGMGQVQGCTPFMTLLGVFYVLLHRYTHQSTLCVGTPIANRLQSDVEPLIGFFVNTLALRTDIDNRNSFRELLVQVKEIALSAYEHQIIPFEKVVEILQPERSQAHAPLFQSMFVLQNTHQAEFTLPHICIEQEYSEWNTSKFDLTLTLQELSDGELAGGFEYATDLFDESTIARLAAHFVSLAKAVIVEPDTAIGQVEFLSAQEKHQLLVQWNDTNIPFPADKCIHELFEAQVEQSPDATAVIFEDEHLTYRELNERANQLAHYLVARGVKPDSLVGICVERSLDMVIGLLGILKAGGAYVPLDPEYPVERIEHMQKDAALNIVLTKVGVRDRIYLGSGNTVLLDDPTNQDKIRQYSVENISPKVLGLNSSHLAYVIYTSGSTGNPKGVMICHSNTNALYKWAQKTYTKEELCLVLASTSICFDLSVFEILVGLQLGAKIFLVQDILSLAYSGHFKDASERISLINTVPSAIKQLLELDAIPASVKVVNLAGEPLKQELVDALYSSGIPKVYDLYGPSEDTTYSTYTLRKPLGYANIGRPIQNTQAYLLSSSHQLVPLGSVGELYLGGAGLARGYLNQPDLTAEKFIQSPFSNNPNERLYKTGDLCRYLPDRNIRYIGRIDHQVKIRGFRIELGEIESALLTHSAIKDVAVLVREDSVDGSSYLAAFVVAKNEVDTREVRKYLGHKLPGYMIPNVFHFLPELPLTASGKVDRKALNETKMQLCDDSHNKKHLSTTNLEERIISVWESTLGIQKVGVDSNFFDLGGHSLKAMSLCNLLRKELGVTLRFYDVLQNPTVREISKLIEIKINESQAEVDKFYKADKEVLVPVSFMQELVLEILDVDEFNNMPLGVCSGFELQGSIDVHVFTSVIHKVLSMHDVLNSKFIKVDGEHYLKSVKGGSYSYQYYDLSTSGGNEESVKNQALHLMREHTERRFDVYEGDLARFLLIKLSEKTFMFYMNVCHIIFDGWSSTVLMTQIKDAYTKFRRGDSTVLPQPLHDFRDYALSEKKWLSAGVYNKSLSFWSEQLRNHKFLYHDIFEKPEHIRSDTKLSYVPIELDGAINEQIAITCSRLNISYYNFFMCLFHLTIYSIHPVENLVVFSNLALRDRLPDRDAIGLYLNRVLIVSEKFNHLAKLEAIRYMNSQINKCMEHGEVNVGLLMKQQGVKERSFSTPICFNYNDFTVVNTSHQKEIYDFDSSPISQSTFSEPRGWIPLVMTIHKTVKGFDVSMNCRPSVYSSEKIDVFATIYKANLLNVLNDVIAKE